MPGVVLTVANGVARLAVLEIAGCLYNHRHPQEQSLACEGILQQSMNMTKLADDLLENKYCLGLVEECAVLRDELEQHRQQSALLCRKKQRSTMGRATWISRTV